MARDEDDDLYDEEFDFVDDEDDGEDQPADGSDLAEEAAAESRSDTAGTRYPDHERGHDEEEAVDEYGRPEPAANYVVHIYENKKFKRTIDRPFTPEDAESFATEYNRTSRPYHRFALAGKNDSKPKKTLDER
jgi:hypothetical protein